MKKGYAPPRALIDINGPDCHRRTGETYKNNRRTTVKSKTTVLRSPFSFNNRVVSCVPAVLFLSAVGGGPDVSYPSFKQP